MNIHKTSVKVASLPPYTLERVLFLRWRRTNPMIIAHALINSVAFIGYALLAGHVSWLP